MPVFTFYATQGAVFDPNNNNVGTTYLTQGTGANGYYANMKTLLVFDTNAIRNALAGYTVTACDFNCWVYDIEGSNATMFLGTHNYATMPSVPSNNRLAADRVRYSFSMNTLNLIVRGVNLGATIGQEFKDGVTSGLLIGPATFNALDNGIDIMTTGAEPADHKPYITITAVSAVPPSPPTQLSPANNAVTDAFNAGVTLSWLHSDPNGDPQAAYYLRRQTGSGTFDYWNGTNFVSTETRMVSSSSTVTIPPGKWANGTSYSWSVKTEDTGGLVGTYSGANVLYASSPPAATVTAPTGNQTTARPTVRWNFSDPEGQAQYGWIVQVVDSTVYNQPGYNPDNYTSPVFSTSGTGTTSSVVSPVDLQNHHTYRAYVRVSASPLPSSALQFSPWASSTFGILIAPYAPSMVFPQNGSVADLAAGFTMDWSNNFFGPGTQSAFAIRRITAGGSYQWWNGLNWSSTTEVFLSGTQSQYAFRPNEISNGVSYTFSVAIRDDYSQVSPYSSGATVTGSAAAQITIISPQGTAITTKPLVQWSVYDPENDPQQTYQVRIIAESVYSGQGGNWDPGTATAVWDSTEIADTSGLTRSVVVGTNLTNGSTYRAYIRVKTGGIYSGWTYSEFPVSLVGPAAPQVSAMVDQTGAAVIVTIQGRDSFLDTATAGNSSGWQAETNATVANQVFFASARSGRISTLTATTTGTMAARSTATYPVYTGQIYTFAATISMATGTPGGGKQSYVTLEFLDAGGATLSTVTGNTIVDDSAQRSVVTAAAPDRAVNARLHVAIIEPVPTGGVHSFFDPVFRTGTGGEWSPGGLVGLTNFSVRESGSDRLVRWAQNVSVPTTNQIVTCRDEDVELGVPQNYAVTTSTVYAGGAVLTSVPGAVGPLTFTSGWLWLSDPLRPGTARSFGPQALGDITRPVRRGKFRPIGREDAVITTGTRGLREGSFDIITWTRDEREAFQDLVESSNVLLLRIPPDQGDPEGDTIYIKVDGDAPESRPLPSRTPHRKITQSWVEQYRPLDFLD